MANEITLSVATSVSNAGYVDSLNGKNQQINQNTLGASAGIATVPTSYAAVPVGSIATNGIMTLTNLDVTNYLEVGVAVSSTFYPVVRIEPGETYVFRVSASATLEWQANTAACKAQFLWLND